MDVNTDELVPRCKTVNEEEITSWQHKHRLLCRGIRPDRRSLLHTKLAGIGLQNNRAKLNRLGLWVHCFRSLADPHDPSFRRFFVGCRWIYDPFTTGYDEIRGYLVPPFMIATQFFFTLAFIAVLLGVILTVMYFSCCSPDQKQYVSLIKLNAFILLCGGISGGVAVIVFAACANQSCIGVVACLVSSTLFFVDGYVQQRKKRELRDSQARIDYEPELKGCVI
ncbi:hypothetical protein NQ317_018991 [Molorchus minor]|uniref:Uncharacterized protein n=1 Tax=Molorchus minor TaxID=1323400 RepID=A0ABQ9JMJ2_9CUCU|nr:hypothetical protein NQ317_018991 [Molorchus minor]